MDEERFNLKVVFSYEPAVPGDVTKGSRVLQECFGVKYADVVAVEGMLIAYLQGLNEWGKQLAAEKKAAKK